MSDQLNQFQQITHDEWEFRMTNSPIFATRTGDHRFNDRLDETTEKANEDRMREIKGFIERLSQINSGDFSQSDAMNYDILNQHLNKELTRLEDRVYRMPISKVAGFFIFFPQMYLFTPLNTKQDYENFLARLKSFPDLIEGHIEVMKKGLSEGYIPPKATLEGVAKSISSQLTEDLTASPYFIPFAKLSPTLDEEEVKDILYQGKMVVSEIIFPTLKKFLLFFEEEYYPQAREDIAAINLPNGNEYYQRCIKYFTSLDLTAKEIHEIGLSEVKRIRNEMKETIKDANFDGSINEFIKFLRTDPQFYVDDPETLLEKTSLVLKRMDGLLPTLFKTLPRLPYGIKPIPDYAAPGTTTAYYQPGTGDGTKAGTYYVNTYDLKSRPLFEVEALSLHEAVPGHHLQIALQYELNLPNFRRFARFTAFTEGWGLYSERLGLEAGFYQDPYSNFGRLSYEMWRASRLVVDTGMHVLGWSRQKAIDFMMENTSLSELNVINEIDRYISWPGQALAYKLGELKIRELRALAEKELGEQFDIREFHDAVLLDGPIPLNVLELQIHNWINLQKIRYSLR